MSLVLAVILGLFLLLKVMSQKGAMWSIQNQHEQVEKGYREWEETYTNKQLEDQYLLKLKDRNCYEEIVERIGQAYQEMPLHSGIGSGGRIDLFTEQFFWRRNTEGIRKSIQGNREFALNILLAQDGFITRKAMCDGYTVYVDRALDEVARCGLFEQELALWILDKMHEHGKQVSFIVYKGDRSDIYIWEGSSGNRINRHKQSTKEITAGLGCWRN